MAPPVDLTDLTNAVGKYADQHQLLVAAGPMTAGAVVRTVTKNKLLSSALVGGGAVLAIKEIAGPSLALIHEQFGYLLSLLGN